MTEGKLYGVCYVCERTTGSKYSVNNHGRKCTGRAAAIPAVGCRCGVSPIMSTIIQRYRERAEIRRSRRRSRGLLPISMRIHAVRLVRARVLRPLSFPPTFVVDSLVRQPLLSSIFLSLSLSLSLSLILPFSYWDSSWFSSVPGRNRSRSPFPYQKPQSTSISAPMGPEFP